MENNNKNLVLCEIYFDEIEERWHFTASLPNFSNETIENRSTETKEQATEEMEAWIENYSIEYPEALIQIKAE